MMDKGVKRIILSAAILGSGFTIAAAFMALNTPLHAVFWPVLVVSLTVFGVSVKTASRY
jgi:hypothetical protein